MTRITKEIATNVALKMTAKKTAEIKKLKTEMKEIGYLIAKTTIPKNILEIFEKNKGYFNNCSGVYINGVGINRYWISFDEWIPSKDGNYPSKEVDEKTANKIVKLKNTIEDKEKLYKKLIQEIEIALYNLRTYEKVKINFKEAYEFLPSQIITSLAINIDSIRENLN